MGRKSPLQNKPKLSIIFIPFTVMVILIVTAGTAFYLVWQSSLYHSFLIVADPVTYLFHDTSENRLIEMQIKADTFIESPHSFGWYPINSFWELGKIDHRGGEVLMKSFQAALSLPVDGYLYRPGVWDNKGNSRDADGIFRSGYLTDLLRGKIESNFPKRELFFIYIRYVFLKPVKVIRLELAHEPLIVKKQLPDESSRPELNYEALRVFIGSYLELARVRRENIPVRVVNSSSAAGLARRTAVMFERLGMNVLTVANESPDGRICLIAVDRNYENSQTVKLLHRLFRCETVTEEGTMGVSVKFGEGYAELIRS